MEEMFVNYFEVDVILCKTLSSASLVYASTQHQHQSEQQQFLFPSLQALITLTAISPLLAIKTF